MPPGENPAVAHSETPCHSVILWCHNEPPISAHDSWRVTVKQVSVREREIVSPFITERTTLVELDRILVGTSRNTRATYRNDGNRAGLEGQLHYLQSKHFHVWAPDRSNTQISKRMASVVPQNGANGEQLDQAERK